MNFQEILQEINDVITTNGANEITGAKLNTVLKDIISAIDAELPQHGKVTVFISGSENWATFLWPYEDTPLSDLTFEGYNGLEITENNAYPVEGMRITSINGSFISEYSEGEWFGDFDTLEKGKWYAILNGDASSANCMVMIGTRTV